MSDERRTLVLMRHAKSDYPAAVATTIGRSRRAGNGKPDWPDEWLRSGVIDPVVQAVLCSTATRTRQTLARTGVDAPTQFLDRLYGATPGAIVDEINGIDEGILSLLVVGHEPAMSQLALGLTGAEGSNATAAEHISIKYPTSAMAVLRVAGPWSALEPGSAALTTFYVPR